MKIIQRRFLIFTPLLLSLFLPTATHAQTTSHRLWTADSLFQAKRYTQSLAHYEEILSQNQYTPAMLLKMAYIHEGLDQTGQAMYHLNLYYLATRDEAALAKMDEIATKYNLKGYNTSDRDRAIAFYLENHLHISLALAAIALLMLSIMYHTRVKRHSSPISSGIALAVTLLALATHLFLGTPTPKAIVADQSTYLMAGPSAGAEVVDVISDGHRVKVIGKTDVWLEIRWDNRVAYVKERAVRPLLQL